MDVVECQRQPKPAQLALIVTDGPMALLSAESFIGTARAMTSHFDSGELAFNAHSRLAIRNSRRVRVGPLHIPTEGEGIDDPYEPETWGAGLSLIDEHLMARAPEVTFYPTGLRTLARLFARSTRLARTADRVNQYRFGQQQTGQPNNRRRSYIGVPITIRPTNSR